MFDRCDSPAEVGHMKIVPQEMHPNMHLAHGSIISGCPFLSWKSWIVVAIALVLVLFSCADA